MKPESYNPKCTGPCIHCLHVRFEQREDLKPVVAGTDYCVLGEDYDDPGFDAIPSHLSEDGRKEWIEERTVGPTGTCPMWAPGLGPRGGR